MITVRKLLRDRRGASMVEYIILVGVIALISIAAFQTFQGKIVDRTEKEGEEVQHIPIK